LLAPAGDFDAACAALHYGADAVYAGLPRFSARADATNLSSAELRQLLAYAHGLPRPRRVYVVLNTLMQARDLPGALEALEELDDAGVDAVIVQDLGLARLAQRHFPRLRLHASTQLAAHNLAGLRALAALGFQRVVLARELPLDEAAYLARTAPVEIEIFVHGALCYSYSGLCLFSSHQTGRSGNRGRCAYCCREPLTPATTGHDPGRPSAFPFSMRDLALAPLLPQLRQAGLASLKIEGRMKSPCYVACVTDYYRRKLDQQLTPDQEATLVQDLQTIFSRPWSSFYAAGRQAPADTIIDAAAIGHRGAAIGELQTILRDGRGGRWLRFQTRRALEKHDGLQILLPRGGKPFGCAVDAMRRAGSSRLEITLPAGATVEVLLPDDAPTDLPAGATVFCSASQAVRRHYQIQRPPPAAYRAPRLVQVHVALDPAGLTLSATTLAPAPDSAQAERDPPADLPPATHHATIHLPLSLTPARQPDQTATAIQRALARSGDTPWQMTTLTVDDPHGLFAPTSALNQVRRQLFEALTTQHEAARQARRAAVSQACALPATPPATHTAATCHWSVKLDLATPPDAAFASADEIILHLGHRAPDETRALLSAWRTSAPRARLRLALPLLTRQHEEEGLRATLAALLADGWQQWECADLGGWQMLHEATPPPLDLTADWSCYALNPSARALLAELGITRAVASPEDSGENLLALAAAPGPTMEVLAWQQTPLFIAETAPLLPGAPPWRLTTRRGSQLYTHVVDHRWVTIAEEPFGLAAHLPTLQHQGIHWCRADFLWTPPATLHLPTCWQAIQAGTLRPLPALANFSRGLA
jgi:putative protease